MRFYAVDLLPPSLWADDDLACRSKEFSPLYVERYHGPLESPVLTEHGHWELTFVFNGEATLNTQCGRQWPLHPNTACLIPPHTRHIERSAGAMDILWIGLLGYRLEGLDPERPRLVRTSVLGDWCSQLWRRSRLRHHAGIGPELDGLSLVIFSLFLRHLGGHIRNVDHRIDDAVDVINAHYELDLSVADLAGQVGWSEGHFYREFRKRTGRTPVAYLTEVRIRHAIGWLRNSAATVARIAELVGYSDSHYFSRVFKSRVGESPAAFRAAHRSGDG